MFEFLKIAVEFWIGVYNSPAVDLPNVQIMISPILAAALPAIFSLGGSLIDKIFGSDGSTPEQQVEQQKEASRFNVLTPFGSSEWEGDNIIKKLSPQMQDMMDRKFDYRNSALDNALDWFGGPSTKASDFGKVDTEMSVGEDPNSGKENIGYPGSLKPGDDGLVYNGQDYVDWGEAMGWGPDASQWGMNGNIGLPLWMVEKGNFPTNLGPDELQTWWEMTQSDPDYEPYAQP